MVLLVLLLGGPLLQTSHAQVWTRTAHVIAPVGTGPLHALSDTLVQVGQRADGLPVRRSPDQGTGMAMSALRDTLQSRYSLDVTGADYVIVGYRFSITAEEGFTETLTDLHFLFRGSDITDDISLLYLDPQQPWIQAALQNKGVHRPTSPPSLRPFREYLRFLSLTFLEESDVVEIGGRTIHEGFDVEKQSLIRQVHSLTYKSY